MFTKIIIQFVKEKHTNTNVTVRFYSSLFLTKDGTKYKKREFIEKLAVCLNVLSHIFILLSTFE